jgi:hypothetical protein
MAGFIEIASRGGTIMIVPRLLPHNVWAAPNAKCLILACAPLGSWQSVSDASVAATVHEPQISRDENKRTNAPLNR